LRKPKVPDEPGNREIKHSQSERAENDGALSISPGVGLPHQNVRKGASYEIPIADELFREMNGRLRAAHMVDVIYDVIAGENDLRRQIA
jgi:hypothetical protein